MKLWDLVTRLNSGGGYAYYVDSVNGSDDNAGTKALPFATLTKLMTVWTAGQSVGLAKGSTWAEMLVIPGGRVSIHAYGTGDMPKITAFDTLSSDGWTKTGGQTNVYERTLSGMTVAAATLIGLNLFEAGAQATYYSSIANLDAAATVPGYYVANPGTATPTLYINASGADKDPATNGKLYEYNKRDACIQLLDDGYTDWTVNGIWCRGGYQTGGVIRTGTSCTVSNCKVTDGNKYSIFIRDGCTVTGTTVINGHHPTEAGVYQIIYNTGIPTGLGVTITNNALGWSATTAPRFTACHGITGHYNTSGTFGALTITGNTFTNLVAPVSDPRDCSSIVMANNVATNTQYLIGAPSRTGTGSQIPITSTDDAWTSTLTNCRVIDNGALAAITVTRLTANLNTGGTPSTGLIRITAAAPITLVNCTINDNQTANYTTLLSCSSAGATLSVTGCTLKMSLQKPFYTFTAGASGMTWTSDNNTFDYAGQFQMSIFGTSYTAFATYQAAVSPQDANSTAV